MLRVHFCSKKKRRRAYSCIRVGKRRKRRRKRLLCGIALIGTFSTFTMFGLMWSSRLVPCMAVPLPRSVDASSLYRGVGVVALPDRPLVAASAMIFLAGLSTLVQSMEREEDEEADAEEDLLTDLKNLVRTKPGCALPSGTAPRKCTSHQDLANPHGAATSRTYFATRSAHTLRSNPITRYRQSSRSPATRRVYISVFRAPQWHGATQTHFSPRPRKSAWRCDIAENSPHGLPTH